MRKRTFIANVFKMSFAMLAANLSNICYSIYISARAGAEAIGVFHLVMSVYSMATVISVSGIGLTVTRLVSDSYGRNNGHDSSDAVSKSMKLCLITSCLAGIILFAFSDKIAGTVLAKPECAQCLRILAPSLVFLAVSAVIGGYFTANGSVSKIIFGKFVSEAIVWLVTPWLLGFYGSGNSYMAIVVALAVSIVAECICDIILWLREHTNRLVYENKTGYGTIISLCAPIAVGSYLRTGLSSIENIIIPGRLTLFGVKDALAQYGIIKGMALPVMMFPAVFTNAFSSLTVPEIARRRSANQLNSVRYISELAVEYALKFAVMISGIFFIYHADICRTFYNEKNAGIYLGFLSILPLLMFSDTVIDSVLKGLDKQVASLKINIADSFCRVIIIAVFVPKFGIAAYIAVLYVSELFNVICSYFTLKKTCRLSFPLKAGLIQPLLASVGAGIAVVKLTINSYVSEIFLFCMIYVMLICIFKYFDKI